MEIEPAFHQLYQTFQILLKNILARRHFFQFLNLHYETTVFKAQQTTGKLKPQEQQEKKQKTEEIKIDSRVEEALETAKKVWTGTKPLESKTSTAIKKPEPKKTIAKRPEPKRPDLKLGQKPGPTQVLIQDINPIDTFSVSSIMVNPDLMGKYQDLKAKYSSSLGSALGGMTQGKKTESAAKKSFLAKLNKKFTSKNIRTEIDQQASLLFAAHKTIHEIDQIVNDDQILSSFFDLSSKPIQNFTQKPEERTKLYKACFTLNIIQKSIHSIKAIEPLPLKSESSLFSSLILSALTDSEPIEKPDSFIVEKNILNELLKTCTKEEVHEVITKYEKLDKWRLGNEVNKFLVSNLPCTKSLPGLRVLHSLGCKKGRSFCTFTKT